MDLALCCSSDRKQQQGMRKGLTGMMPSPPMSLQDDVRRACAVKYPSGR